MSVPVTVIVVSRNEQKHIGPCLTAIGDFGKVVVVDSHSTDATAGIAREMGAKVFSYKWDGAYPKKRQWILDQIDLPYNWVLFIDADERLTQKCKTEIARIFDKGPDKHGYYIKGLYKIGDRVCHHGFKNNKLALFHKNYLRFPVIDDLACPGMGEIEGHYQPGPPDVLHQIQTGQIRAPIIHLALNDKNEWYARHERYARWAVCMTRRKAWPGDPRPLTALAKSIGASYPRLTPFLAFLHSFILKAGWIDGHTGWKLARSRYFYYKMISRELAKPQQSQLRRKA